MIGRKILKVALVVGVLCVATGGTAFLFLSSGTGSATSTSCGANSCASRASTTSTTTTATETIFITGPTVQTTKTLTMTATTTTTKLCCNASTHRLGFWLQEADIMDHYSASAFFNAMFLTPPYPSSIEMMVFGILQDQHGNRGCNTGSGYIGSSLSYWGQVAQLADSYRNIRLVFEIAFNATSSTYGLGCFNSVAQGLAQYPSVYGIGVEGEYTRGITEGQMQTAMNDVSSLGKQFINYFIRSIPIPSGGYQIYHTNFPMQGDQVGTLMNNNSKTSQTVGISSGYYDSFPFPSNFTCPIGPGAVASGALTNEPQGYNQCVVSTELSTAVSLPIAERQFVEFAPGFSSSGSFTGASGLSTDQLWDSPTLRNWIWTDPIYQDNFIFL
jgi:hypothetical protein